MNKYIEVLSYDSEGYSPVVDSDSWRVAILNYIDELEPLNISNFQAHLETDEVFVLLSGRCILYLGDKQNNNIVNIKHIDMKPNKIYNIKRGVYHTHTLSSDAKVLIMENRNTSDDNSPKVLIGDSTRSELNKIALNEWKKFGSGNLKGE